MNQKAILNIRVLKYPIALIFCLISSAFYYSFSGDKSSGTVQAADMGDTKYLSSLPEDNYELKNGKNGSNSLNFTDETTAEKNAEYNVAKDKIVEQQIRNKTNYSARSYEEPRYQPYKEPTIRASRESESSSDTKKNKDREALEKLKKEREEFEKKMRELNDKNSYDRIGANGNDGSLDMFNMEEANPVDVTPKSRFYGLSRTSTKSQTVNANKKGNKKLILAQLTENKTVTNGEDVKVLIREDFVYNGKTFSSGSIISGKATISGGRLQINFNGLIENGVYYAVVGNVFDTDASLGLNYHVEEGDMAKRNAKTQGATSMLQQTNPLLIYNPTGNIGQQVSTQIVGSMVNQGLNAASSIFQGLAQIEKVKIKSGQICYLNLKED